MDNIFLTQLFDWGRRDAGRWMGCAQRVLRAVGIPWQLRQPSDPAREMTNIEQRLNLWHLATQPIAYDVPGDYVELGCFDGKTAVIFQKILDAADSSRLLHLYDHFQIGFHLHGRDIRAELEANFRAAAVGSPLIHAGDFRVTIPAQLPECIAFVHIDCGFGGDPTQHEAIVTMLLGHVYPRMPRGAIGVLMDYHEPGLSPGVDFNPGAGRAARAFFLKKPEKVCALWAGEYTHGYFRKQ